MTEKNLLSRLKDRKISIEKMISTNEEFVSEYFGSCSTEGGHVNYSKIQMEVLFASVPDIFPYDWEFEKDLTEKQSTVLGIIHNLKIHPSYNLKFDKIPKIISVANMYAEGRIKQEA